MAIDISDKTIIRRERSKENPYFLMARGLPQNRSMSYEAIGMASYILSKPDDWEIMISDLIRESAGRDKVYRIIGELVESGHLVRKEGERVGGRFTPGSYLFLEAPDTALPDTAQPDTAQPDTANPTLHIREYTEERTEQSRETDCGPEKDAGAAANPPPAPPVRVAAFVAPSDDPKAKHETHSALDSLIARQYSPASYLTKDQLKLLSAQIARFDSDELYQGYVQAEVNSIRERMRGGTAPFIKKDKFIDWLVDDSHWLEYERKQRPNTDDPSLNADENDPFFLGMTRP
ncbi:MAG: hypothetical protein J0M07_03800 [Anaerolineae bacterium]|nr:hypothetical protein [Anaerolineae bacterium]